MSFLVFFFVRTLILWDYGFVFRFRLILVVFIKVSFLSIVFL